MPNVHFCIYGGAAGYLLDNTVLEDCILEGSVGTSANVEEASSSDGAYIAGSIAGMAVSNVEEAGIIRNCLCDVTITGSWLSGALVGNLFYFDMSNCLFLGENFDGRGACSNGTAIIDAAYYGSLEYCYAPIEECDYIYITYWGDVTYNDSALLTEEELKSQDLVDLLNTGLEEPVWQYNEGGYPTLNIK